MLLRAGGIAARYATDFVAAEKSERENAWLVRTRLCERRVGGYGHHVCVVARHRDYGINSNDQQMLIAASTVVFPFTLRLMWRLARSRRRS